MSEHAHEHEQHEHEHDDDVDAAEGPSDEERRAWRLAALRLVRQYPDPVLKNPAVPVGEPDDELRALTARMTDIMRASHGVGLAAPQIGVSRRVLVYGMRDDDVVHVLVNPELVERSEETEVENEGCLSLLGGELSIPVERHVRVRVSATDADGEVVEYEAEGLEARVIQHEIDHLDGVLIVDRAQNDERKGALRELRLRSV
jgi:peptide deformylase